MFNASQHQLIVKPFSGFPRLRDLVVSSLIYAALLIISCLAMLLLPSRGRQAQVLFIAIRLTADYLVLINLSPLVHVKPYFNLTLIEVTNKSSLSLRLICSHRASFAISASLL